MKIHNPLNDFFYFSREERRGILVLFIAIILVILCGHLYSYWKEKPSCPTAEETRQKALAEAEYKAFMASIQEEEEQWKKKKYPRYNHQHAEDITLAVFNPNTADSVTFRKLGLPGWMARNILHYRDKGGKFRKAEDFKKVYGLTTEQYQKLLPYIQIASKDTLRHAIQLYAPPTDSNHASLQADSYKYPPGTVIDLNQADTTELKKIPGIGSGIARLIASYRQRLGGYYRIEQLQEIHLDYQQLEAWFRINPQDIHRVSLNRIGIERLRNHPYVNFYQAKAFIEYRKKKGMIHSLKPFALYEEFSEADLDRIGHYVCFE